MTTNEISTIIINNLCERQFPIYLTTYFGQGMNEADVFAVNKNGYMYEYEIKRSLSDYYADFKNKTYKHGMLKSRDAVQIYDERVKGKRTGNTYESISIPNRFYYVCEDGLISIGDIPEYAGLLYIRDGKLVEQKSAPMLHKNKANERVYARISTMLSERIIYGCSYRTHKQKSKLGLKD